MEMSPISIALLKAREAKGLTQVQLAKKAKVRQATISEMEAGKTVRLNLDVLDRLCRVLGVEPGDLLEREKPTKRRKR
jgi:DNA-binding Xre family transcriptional regulator